MIPQKTMNMLKRMSHSEMLDTLHQLVRLGIIERNEVADYMYDITRNEDREETEFMRAARKMLRTANANFEKRKKKTLCSCPHCGGIGKRNVCVSTSWCQGNYRRADGSYHREEDGTETVQEYKWKICPDCHGTGEIYQEE